MSSIWQPTLLCLAWVFFGEETDKTEKLLSRQSNQIQHDRERWYCYNRRRRRENYRKLSDTIPISRCAKRRGKGVKHGKFIFTTFAFSDSRSHRLSDSAPLTIRLAAVKTIFISFSISSREPGGEAKRASLMAGKLLGKFTSTKAWEKIAFMDSIMPCFYVVVRHCKIQKFSLFIRLSPRPGPNRKLL